MRRCIYFLSPEGIEASAPDYWCSMSYQDVLNIVDNARKKVNLLQDLEWLINNYVEAIRRDIVRDERLVQICTEIYAKHKKALDLILEDFENKPDRASEVADILKTWAINKTERGEIGVVLDKCSKSYIRFKTKKMSDILPDLEEENSGWNTKNHYFYEIRNNEGTGFFLALTFSSRNLSDEQRKICDQVNKHFPSRQQKENWQWRTPFTTRLVKLEEELFRKAQAEIEKKSDAKAVSQKMFKVV